MAAKRNRRPTSEDNPGEPLPASRSGGVDMHAQEAHVAGDVVGRDKTEFNIGRATIISLDRRVFFAITGLLVLVGVSAIIISSLGRTAWATWEPVDENLFGIAVAEFTVGGELREAPQGAETSRLIYAQLDSDLKQAGLDDRVVLTKVGALRTAEEATQAGERVHADIVLWGWVPEFEQESIVPNFTLIGEQTPRSDLTFVDSLNLIISGPGTIRLSQISGRATSLSRFILGLVYLRDARSVDYEESLKMFKLGAQELEQDLKRFSELLPNATDIGIRTTLEDAQLATQKSLAIFYTLQGISYAALGKPDDALASYDAASELDDSYPRLHTALGNYYYGLRRYDEAQSAYQRALDLDGNNSSAHYGLGLTSYYLGDYDSAVSDLNTAIRLAQAEHDEQTTAQAYLVLGYSHAALGQSEEALEAFLTLLESPAASDTDKQAARDQISAIENPSPTATSTPTMLPTPEATATQTRTASTTPTLRPTATSFGPAIDLELLAPAWGSTHRSPIQFEWRGSLRSDQSYQVTTYHLASGDTLQSGLLSEPVWTVELPRFRDGEWRWRVAVLSGNSVVATSNESFFWFNPLLGTEFPAATPIIFGSPIPTGGGPVPTARPTGTLFPTVLATPPQTSAP